MKNENATELEYLPPILNLVFEGGGIKCLVYLGALKALAEKGLLQSTQCLAGSSAGAITAMLLGLGYSISEIQEIMYSLDFTKFMDKDKKHWWDPFNFITNIKAYITLLGIHTHGLYKGDEFHHFVQQLVCRKLGKPNATFRDLHEAMKNNSSLKEIYFTGTNLSQGGTEQVFSYETTPDFPIADAVRISMSFPGVFKAVEVLNAEGEPEIMVDGGVSDNYPMQIFDQRRYMSPGTTFTDNGANPCTLGFKVDSKLEREVLIWNIHNHKDQIDTTSPSHYLGALVNAMQAKSWEVSEKYGFNTVQIPDLNISTFNFDITHKQKEELINEGYNTTIQWFKNYREKDNCTQITSNKRQNFQVNKLREIKKLVDHSFLRYSFCSFFYPHHKQILTLKDLLNKLNNYENHEKTINWLTNACVDTLIDIKKPSLFGIDKQLLNILIHILNDGTDTNSSIKKCNSKTTPLD